jgi:hypothetical protein
MEKRVLEGHHAGRVAGMPLKDATVSEFLYRLIIATSSARITFPINQQDHVRTIKFKINGRCMNHCSFCPFHSNPSLLEVRDLERFFGLLERNEFRRLVINGGEPTVHPRFFDICRYLRARHKGRMPLMLGTNLISFGWSRGRCAAIKSTVFDTFDGLEVGCDDEHGNIVHLERFASEILAEGLKLNVNVVSDYCSEETKGRILRLQQQTGFRVGFSETHHFCRGKPLRRAAAPPCRKRMRDLLINCNGDAYFCFLQEMEQSFFNLRSVTGMELAHILKKHKPPAYQYCEYCPRYEPGGLRRVFQWFLKSSPEGKWG